MHRIRLNEQFVQEDAVVVDWLNGAVGVAGLLIALFALWQTRRSNRAADEANNISREANAFAKQAMQLQEDESRLKLVVKPQMLQMIGDGEDRRARPVVTVINLSVFPVTIEKIWWKTVDSSGGAFYWKNPKITAPFDSLPARLDSHQALTAVGKPDCFKSVDDFLSITAAVAATECGESVPGMTPQWEEYREKVRAKRTLHWDDDDAPNK